MSDGAPSEDGGRDSIKSKSSSNKSEEDSWWSWKGLKRSLTGSKRKNTPEKKRSKKRQRRGSAQDRAGTRSAIERRNTQGQRSEYGLEPPPQTRQENFPQRVMTDAEAQADRRGQHEPQVDETTGHEPIASRGNAQEAVDQAPEIRAVPSNSNEQAAQGRDSLSERSTYPEPVVPKFVAPSGPESQRVTSTPAKGCVEPRGDSPVDDNGIQRSGDNLRTYDRIVSSATGESRLASGGSQRPQTAESSTRPPLSMNTLPATYTHAAHAVYDQYTQMWRCPFEALGTVIPEFERKCNWQGAVHGPTMVQHVLRSHPPCCHICYEYFRRLRTKQDLDDRITTHICPGAGRTKPATCLWPSKAAQDDFFALERHRWTQQRWEEMIGSIAPSLGAHDMPHRYKMVPAYHISQRLTSPATSHSPLPTEELTSTARQTQPPERGAHPPPNNAAIVEECVAATGSVEPANNIPSPNANDPQTSQPAHEVDPVWQDYGNLFFDHETDFDRQLNPPHNPMNPSMTDIDDTTFENILSGATAISEAGPSDAAVQNTVAGALQLHDELGAQDAPGGLNGNQGTYETSNKIEDFKIMLQAESPDLLPEFERLMHSMRKGKARA